MATMASLMAAAGRPRPSSPIPSLLRVAASKASLRTAAVSARAWGGRHDSGSAGGDSGGSGDGGGWDGMGAHGVAGGAGRGWAMAAAAGLALAVGAGGAGTPREGAKNCGIVGVVSSGEKGQGAEGGVVDFLYEVQYVLVCAACVWPVVVVWWLRRVSFGRPCVYVSPSVSFFTFSLC